MTRIRFFSAAIIFFLWLFFVSLPFSAGQAAPAADRMTMDENTSDSDSVEPLRIKVSVTEVSLDVVVLDKKTGNPITDLTAADFEVYQDNRQQAVKSAVYIDSQPDAATRKNTPNLPLFSAPALKKEDVNRTIMFVVDDYAMTFENGYYTKTALRNFVEKQMQPGDLISIFRTDYGNRALNMFQSNKREVIARINALPSTMAPRLFDPETGMGVSRATWDDFLMRRFENMISTLSYSFRKLENMPGRKILNMFTPFSAPDDPLSDVESFIPPLGTMSLDMLRMAQDSRADYAMRSGQRARFVEDSYKKLSDEAMRAGVVVNYLDIDGLNNFKDPNNSHSFTGASMSHAFLLERLKQVRYDPVPVPNPLPAKTGGVTIMNSNFFLDGIGKEAESLMRGYYLISYTPHQDTFETRGKRDDLYRSLKVRVKRNDAEVHTRSGFFGRLEKQPDVDTTIHPLVEAVYSPFRNDDINVNMAAGYIKDNEAGYRVRSWIHLDPGDVKIVETEDGGVRIDLEALCLASDISGNILVTKSVEFSLSDINVAWIRKHGMRFSMLIPVKNPGPYYIRMAVKDKESEKVGSAYQFLEIPRHGKKELALSNIFTINSADDLNWMRPGVTKEIAEGVFFPMFQDENIQSPALRTYSSGDKLQTLAMLYNADVKAIARSEIETQTILYKDGVEFMRGEPTPITPDKVDNSGSIPLLNRLTVGTNMPPGDYVLQILAIDKKSNKKNESAVYQTLGFKVAEN